jgi:hypothetical protein
VSSRVECDIHMDITELIKKLYGGYSNYGFLLMTPEYEDAGFIILVEKLMNVINEACIKLAINPAAVK